MAVGWIVGGSIAAGLLGSKSASDAANASSAASQAATAEQARQFNINQFNQAPFLGTGYNALNAYSEALGIPYSTNTPYIVQQAPVDTTQQTGAPPVPNRGQPYPQWGQPRDTSSANMLGFHSKSTLAHALFSGATPQAVPNQPTPSTNAFAPTTPSAPGTPAPQNFSNYPNFSYSGQIPQFTPNAPFTFDPSLIADNPEYKFLYDQMIQATNRGAAGAGDWNSGNRLLALEQNAGGLAASQYNSIFNNELNAYNANNANALTNYQINQGNEQNQYARALQNWSTNYGLNQNQYGQYQNYLNRLAALSGVGQTTANELGTAGTNYANAYGNIQMNNAANQAAASNQMYGSWNNAIQGAIGNYLGYKSYQDIMSHLPS